MISRLGLLYVDGGKNCSMWKSRKVCRRYNRQLHGELRTWLARTEFRRFVLFLFNVIICYYIDYITLHVQNAICSTILKQRKNEQKHVVKISKYGPDEVTLHHVPTVRIAGSCIADKKKQDGDEFVILESANIATSHGEFLENGWVTCSSIKLPS